MSKERDQKQKDKSVAGQYTIGFGKVISLEHLDTIGCLKTIPTKYKVLWPFGQYSLVSGAWMRLGEQLGVDVGDQIRTQQGNIALMSALLLTIQFTFMYQFTPDLWDSLAEQSYIAQHIENPAAIIWIHEVFVVLCMTTIILNCMCMAYSVIVILTLGEIDGSEEVNYLDQSMDSRGGIGGGGLSGSFVLFLIALVLWFLKCFVYQCFACQSLSGMVLTILLPVVVYVFVLLGFHGSIIQCAFECKYMSALEVNFDAECDGDIKCEPIQKWSSPLFVDYATMLDYLGEFERQCGVNNLSEDHFTAFVTYKARKDKWDLLSSDKEFSETKRTAGLMSGLRRSLFASIEDKEYRLEIKETAVKVAELCTISREMLKQIVQERRDMLIAQYRLRAVRLESSEKLLLEWLTKNLESSGESDADSTMSHTKSYNPGSPEFSLLFARLLDMHLTPELLSSGDLQPLESDNMFSPLSPGQRAILQQAVNNASKDHTKRWAERR